jgi:hypothetical protein
VGGSEPQLNDVGAAQAGSCQLFDSGESVGLVLSIRGWETTEKGGKGAKVAKEPRGEPCLRFPSVVVDEMVSVKVLIVVVVVIGVVVVAASMDRVAVTVDV